MSSRMRTLATAAIGMIVITVTLVIFFIGFTKNQRQIIDWIALIFTVISELTLFIGIIIINHISTSNQVLMKSGVVTTLFIYWIITVTVSIFGRGLFVFSIGGFITTQIIICAIVAVVIIILSMHIATVNEKDDKLMNSRLLMQECENLVFALRSNEAYNSYYSILNKVYEEIKYSDKTKSVEKEQLIYSKIEELSNYLRDNIENGEITTNSLTKITDEIMLIIKERNLFVKQSKHGGF